MRVVVEGDSDEWAARRIVTYCGHEVTDLRAVGGKTKIDERLVKYSRAARREPWVVFRDSDGECPVDLRNGLLDGVRTGELFALRIACTMTEAWLMADRQGFAEYFHVSVDIVPNAPEELAHAKRALLGLCRRSRNRDIREEVARDDHHPGPLFVPHLNRFARTRWDVGAAARNSPSLSRAVTAIAAMPRGAVS
ncbi:MAG: hypothetical protein ACFN04_01055 [Propionibacterium acidifaciens]